MKLLLAACAVLIGWPAAACATGDAMAPTEVSGGALSRELADTAALLGSPPGAQLSLSALEKRLAADAADGVFNDFSLPAAALIAGGVRDFQVLAHYERRIDEWADELARSGAVRGAPREQARAILAFLHQRILTGEYDEDRTELDRLLNDGRYNCVSSLILFVTLCQRFAVPVIALESPGHCYAVLTADQGPFEIETTCADWFDLSDAGRLRRQKQGITAGRHDEHGGGDASDGSTIDSPRRELTGPALAAIVYYNRAIDRLRQNAFAEAAAANQMALRLDPASSDARDNLLATLNNWALDLCEHGDREGALAVLRHGLTAAPNHAKLRRNFVAISQRRP